MIPSHMSENIYVYYNIWEISETKLLIMTRKSVEMTIPTQTMIIRTMFKCSLVLWFHISLCVSIFADNQTMRYSLVFEFEVVVLTNTLYCCFFVFRRTLNFVV